MTTESKNSTAPSVRNNIEPGVYPEMSEEDYFALLAVSNSILTPLEKSPAHCKYAMTHPKEPTEAMILGSAVDTLVFTPTVFNERFAVPGQCEAKTQKGKRCSNQASYLSEVFNDLNEASCLWVCGTHFPGQDLNTKTILSEDQSSTAYEMAKAVVEHPGASVLLDACEETQLSLVWKEGGLLCKGRLDGLSRELKTVIDLKTCQDASPEAFSRKIADFGYHRQAAMYMRGCSFHGIEVQNYVIIAVESEPSHAVALYTLTERIPSALGRMGDSGSPVEYGNHELLRLLDLYERCEATGDWPGYAAQPVPIRLPKWAEYQIERGGLK